MTASIQGHLYRLSRIMDDATNRLAEDFGLTPGELAILTTLKRIGSPFKSTPSALLQSHWVSLPGLVKQISRLEEQGLLSREIDPADRRRTFVTLTKKAHTLIARLERRPTDPEFAAIWDLPIADRQRINEALADLLKIMQRHRSKEA